MAPLIALLRLEPNGHMGAQVTAVGCLAAPTHYSGEHNLCTDVLHHHSTAKGLFAGHRTTFRLHRLMCCFVPFNPDGNNFCLFRSHTAGASVVLCTSATPARPMVCVRWHCQVSRPRVVSWHCGTVFCTGVPLLQGAETGDQLAACITVRHIEGNTLERNAHAV